MKRGIHFISLILVVAAYIVVKSPAAIVAIKPFWFDLYALGDLYRYSFLAEYKDTTQICLPPPASGKSSNLNLYIIGDSFAGPFEKANFPNAKNYSFANWNHISQSTIRVHTDTNAFNILILQCSEKHMIMRLEKNTYKSFLFRVDHKTAKNPFQGFEYSTKAETPLESVTKYIGRQAVTDQNMGILLFSNPAVLKIKEAKAELNQSVFGKIAEEVEEYPTKKMLVQRMTTDLNFRYMSSFCPHPDTELDSLIKNLEKMNHYYRKAGFDTVLLAIVPNPISVINPKYKGRTYNQLLPRIERQVSGLGVISVFDTFGVGKEKYFRKGDSHWNKTGASVWQHAVNSKLNSFVDTRSSRNRNL